MMSYTIPGCKLPEGTLVYVYFTSNNYFLGNTVRRIALCGFSFLNNYIFDPQDELYATEGVRSYWKLHPELHPHATLFEMLYKKLDIK